MKFTKDQIEMIRQERKMIEETKKISEKLLSLMYEHKLFKLFVPKQYNGKMLSLPDAVEVFQRASYIDGNFGWLVTIGSGGGMFVSNLNETASQSIYSPENAVIAGSGFPAGTAKRVEGGYIINGKWLYCSGSQYATTFTTTCQVEGSDDILAFALNPDQVNVLHDWNAFGLKGTSSHSIEVKDEFVSNDYVFSVFHIINDFEYPVYTFPFLSFSEASFCAICLGIGEHFLEQVNGVLIKNKNHWLQNSEQRYNFLKEKLNIEQNRWQKAHDLFYETLNNMWEEHINSGDILEETEQNFSLVVKRVVATVLNSAHNLFRLIGMEMIMEHYPINQTWRDLHTASQHMFLMPSNDNEVLPYE